MLDRINPTGTTYNSVGPRWQTPTRTSGKLPACGTRCWGRVLGWACSHPRNCDPLCRFGAHRIHPGGDRNRAPLLGTRRGCARRTSNQFQQEHGDDRRVARAACRWPWTFQHRSPGGGTKDLIDGSQPPTLVIRLARATSLRAQTCFTCRAVWRAWSPPRQADHPAKDASDSGPASRCGRRHSFRARR